MKYDVTALGELLIDFTPAGESAKGNKLFEQNPGGAPANVLTAVTRQGGRGSIISSVGNDSFGTYLRHVMENARICIDGLQVTKEAATTLAFVSLNESGERSFSFCRKPGADQKIKKEKMDFSLIDDCTIFHFGSLSLSDEPSRSAAIYSAKYAKDKGKIVSYDPNWRPLLWNSLDEGIQGMKLGLPLTDVLKLSEDEMFILSGEKNLLKGTLLLKQQYSNLKLIIVTLGDKGCFYRYGSSTGSVSAYKVKTVDTTGAGDSFWGALLLKIAQNPDCINGRQENYLCDSIDYASASGALCAAGRGAIPSIPTADEVQALRQKVNF